MKSTSSEKYIKTEALELDDKNSEYYPEIGDRNENNTNDFYYNNSSISREFMKIEPKYKSSFEEDNYDEQNQTTDPKLLLNPVVIIEMRTEINQKLLENSKDYSHNDHKIPKTKTHRPLVLKCEFCEKTFRDNYNLNSHVMNIHEDNKKYKCQHCNKGFNQKYVLLGHIQIIHENVRNFVCYFCDKAFGFTGDLKKHLRGFHFKIYGHKCPSCDKSFIEKYKMKIHMKKVHEGLVHHCVHCNNTYLDKYKLTRHIKCVHEGFKCEKNCSCDSESKPHRPGIGGVRNSENVLSNGAKICQHCGKEFLAPYRLKLHIQTVHEGRKDHKCDQCGKMFSQNYKLKNHVQTVHSSGVGTETNIAHKKVCEQCGKSYNDAKDLRRHIQYVHEGIKSVACDLCDKTFARLDSLKKHKKVYHEGTKEQCNFCGKSFTQKHYLSVHIKRFHDLNGGGIVNHKCHYCEKSYSSKQYLQIHIKSTHKSG